MVVGSTPGDNAGATKNYQYQEPTPSRPLHTFTLFDPIILLADSHSPLLPASVGGDYHREVIDGAFIHNHHAEVVRAIVQQPQRDVRKGFERCPSSEALVIKRLNRRA